MINILASLPGIKEVTTRYLQLHNDFTGIDFFVPGILLFIKSLLLGLLLILLLVLLGETVSSKWLKKNDEKYFIYLIIGYVVFGTGLSILGMLSLLYWQVISAYLFVIILISLFPYYTIFLRLKNIAGTFNVISFYFKNYKWLSISILGFVFIAFLRLILPEIGVDALSGHTDIPHLFLKNHTTMIYPNGVFFYITVPHLAHMLYVITEFLGLKETDRVIHFLLYFGSVLLLMKLAIKKESKHNNWVYVPLLFVTTPVIIRHTSTAYVDFQWVIPWIILFYLLIKKQIHSVGSIFLIGIMYGAILAFKLQPLVFFPMILTYLYIELKKNKLLYMGLFIIISLSIPSIWYLRAWILTGNPVYPQFAAPEEYAIRLSLADYFSIEALKVRFISISNFSVLFFCGIASFAIISKGYIKKIVTSSQLLFTLFMCGIYLILPSSYYLGRYLLYGYIPAVFISANLLYLAVNRSNYLKYVLAAITTVIFSYYFLTTLLIIPYGFGWADQNKYLTRILSSDNSSYYDFNHLFSSQLNEKDRVATYHVYGFYYASFDYSDVDYILDPAHKSFKDFKKKKITKIIIKGGTMDWFCQKKHVADCESINYTLIRLYEPAKQYLYRVK